MNLIGTVILEVTILTGSRNTNLPSTVMAEATRSQVAIREQKERLENRMKSKIEACLMEITPPVQHAIHSSVDR